MKSFVVDEGVGITDIPEIRQAVNELLDKAVHSLIRGDYSQSRHFQKLAQRLQVSLEDEETRNFAPEPNDD